MSVDNDTSSNSKRNSKINILNMPNIERKKEEIKRINEEIINQINIIDSGIN